MPYLTCFRNLTKLDFTSSLLVPSLRTSPLMQSVLFFLLFIFSLTTLSLLLSPSLYHAPPPSRYVVDANRVELGFLSISDNKISGKLFGGPPWLAIHQSGLGRYKGFRCRTLEAFLLTSLSLGPFFQKKKQGRISFDTEDFAAEEVWGGAAFPWGRGSGWVCSSVCFSLKKHWTQLVSIRVLPAPVAL